MPHLWAYGTTPGYGVTFDPEGALSTLDALGTTLFGVLAGEELRNGNDRGRQGAVLAMGATGLWLASLLCSHWLVLNKKIWTPSFSLWSAGLSLLTFAALFYLIEAQGLRRGWTLALIFGTNAIFAYVVSSIITTLLLAEVNMPRGKLELHTWLSEHLFGAWLQPRPASLAYAIAIVLFNAALVYPLYRRRLFLRL